MGFAMPTKYGLLTANSMFVPLDEDAEVREVHLVRDILPLGRSGRFNKINLNNHFLRYKNLPGIQNNNRYNISA